MEANDKMSLEEISEFRNELIKLIDVGLVKLKTITNIIIGLIVFLAITILIFKFSTIGLILSSTMTVSSMICFFFRENVRKTVIFYKVALSMPIDDF